MAYFPLNEHGDRIRDVILNDCCDECGQLFDHCGCNYEDSNPEDLHPDEMTLDQIEATTQWFDEKEQREYEDARARGETAGL